MALKGLSGRMAVVTGAGSGIGKAVVERLLEEGARVAALDFDLEKAHGTGGDPEKVFAVQADVTEEASLQKAFAAIASKFGAPDIGVNAAGIGLSVPLLEQSAEQWKRVQDVNLFGVFLCTKMMAQAMLPKRDGVIINIASTNALQPGEGLSAYCASKAGVSMFTRVAAMELASFNIRVAAIGPGLTETPLVARLLARQEARDEFLANIPLGRAAKPADIAAAVAFLASDDASYITGDTLFVDGGALTQRYPSFEARNGRPLGEPASSA